MKKEPGRTQKIAILGFEREGQSLLRFLKKDSGYKNSELWVLDRNIHANIPKGTRSQLGKDYLKNLDRFDIVFRSPGIPYLTPELARARKRGTKFSSATELFFERCPAKIVGVTGTKGKGTTATLIYKTLKAAHKSAWLVGNIGTPALDALPRLTKKSFVVFELSSFQLQDMKRSPHIAVVLHISPDHLDAHKNVKEYYEAKSMISKFQSLRDVSFFFANDAKSKAIASRGKGKRVAVRQQSSLLSGIPLHIPGPHNAENAAMATSVLQYLDIPKSIVAKTIASFRGLPHRLEFIKTIGNVRFYNDSASTNPAAASAAVSAFPGKSVVAIFGGKDKGLDYTPLARSCKKNPPAHIVLFGENKNKIARTLRSLRLPTNTAKTLHEAVTTAFKKASALKNGAVVFSPGSASFDMFRDYAKRGEAFKHEVFALTKKKK